MRMWIWILVRVEIWEHAEPNLGSVCFNWNNQIRFLIKFDNGILFRSFSNFFSLTLNINEFFTKIGNIFNWINIKDSATNRLSLFVFLFWFLVIHNESCLNRRWLLGFYFSNDSIVFDKLHFSIYLWANLESRLLNLLRVLLAETWDLNNLIWIASLSFEC